MGPETHSRHELLRLLELAVAAKDGFDEFDASVLAHGDGLLHAGLLLGGLPHVVLAYFEEHGEADPKTLAALQEVVDHFLVGVFANAVSRLNGPLDLGGKVDQKQPEFAGHLGDGGTWTIVVDGPVEDPLAKGVGIEDGA